MTWYLIDVIIAVSVITSVCGRAQNLCLKATQACKGQRVFTLPRIGVAEDKVAQYAGLHYYTDKELQVTPHCYTLLFLHYIYAANTVAIVAGETLHQTNTTKVSNTQLR